MSNIDKQWLQQKIAGMEAARDEIPFGLDKDDSNTLAALRIALASLEAEPVGYVDAEYAELLKSGHIESCSVYAEQGEGCITVYTAPPAPVSVPEWTNEQCMEFLSIAFRHAEIKGDFQLDDIRLGVKMVNGSRAAMLQGSDANSPVIPDGWVACSERMPEQFKAILAFNEYGEVWSGAYDRYWNFYCDNLLVEHVTHWMPLPAAPRQEV